MSNVVARSFSAALDGLDSGRLHRTYARWLIRIVGTLSALIGVMLVLGVLAAMANSDVQKPFVAWLALFIVMCAGALQAYLQALLAARRSREMQGGRESVYTVLPVVARLVRYSAECGCINFVLVYLSIGLMGFTSAPLLLNSLPLFSSSVGPLLVVSAGVGVSFTGLLMFVLLCVVTITAAAFGLMLAYGLAAVIEGFEDLVTSNRSIDESCKVALGAEPTHG